MFRHQKVVFRYHAFFYWQILRAKLTKTIFTFITPEDAWQPAMGPVGFEPPVPASGRSQLPLDLRHKSAAARLLEMKLRIPTGAWISVSYEYCVLSGRGLCVGLITRPESRTECGMSECDLEASIIRNLWPTRGCWAWKKRGHRSTRSTARPLVSAFPVLCVWNK
jgi:hypothetical protein